VDFQATKLPDKKKNSILTNNNKKKEILHLDQKKKEIDQPYVKSRINNQKKM
jgi:hypothetical protein